MPRSLPPSRFQKSRLPGASALALALAFCQTVPLDAQTVYRWTANNVDFGEAESPWNNASSWDATFGVPPTVLLNNADVVELNGTGGGGFGSSTKEITINATTGSMTVGTLRFGDRDTGSALILTNAVNNPVTGQS